MASQETSQKDVGAVVNAVQILKYLAASTTPLGVAAVARGTGVSTSTCFNILRTLARVRYVAFRAADKTYTLGLGVAELAAGLIGISPAELLRPEMERLALNYEMLILLWRVTEDGHLVLVDRAHSRTAIRVEISTGFRMPMIAGAVGRSVAAVLNLPSAELRRRFAALRWQSPPGFTEYQSDVAQARELGWGVDDGRLYRGVLSIGAAITDQDGQPRFGLSAVSIAAQQTRPTKDLGRELRDVAIVTGASLFPSPKLQ